MLKKALPWIVLLICIVVSVSNLKSQNATNYIMSNYDFTNTSKYCVRDYIIAFGQDYNTNDIRYAVLVFSNMRVNPLMFFLTAWKEGRPRDDYMLGCGIHLKYTHTKTFEPQVRSCAKTWRRHFDTAEANGYSVYLYERNGWMRTFNKATYSIYKYTPRYWQYCYGDWHGNRTIPKIWKILKIKMSTGVDVRSGDGL